MSDNTTITSPFHPQYYPNNQQCQWRIIAPRNYHIRIRFQNFDLAQPGDYVEIRDGYSDSADLIGKFTSSPGAFYLASTGRFLWVRFKSNQENAATGFLLRFKFVFSLIGKCFFILCSITQYFNPAIFLFFFSFTFFFHSFCRSDSIQYPFISSHSKSKGN